MDEGLLRARSWEQYATKLTCPQAITVHLIRLDDLLLLH